MKKISLTIFTMLIAFTVSAQIKAPAGFTCFPSPNGYTLSSSTMSFSQENLKDVLTDQDLINDYLNGFTKNADGTYYRQSTSKGYSYDLFIPKQLIQLTITTSKDKTNFTKYVALLKDFYKKNPTWNTAFFVTAEGKACDNP